MNELDKLSEDLVVIKVLAEGLLEIIHNGGRDDEVVAAYALLKRVEEWQKDLELFR